MSDEMERRLEEWYAGTTPPDASRERHVRTIHEAWAEGTGQRPPASGSGVPPLHHTPRTRRARGMQLFAAAALIIVTVLTVRTARVATGDARLASANDTLQLATPSGHTRRATAHEARQPVGFELQLADASVRQVTLAGDFNGWDTTALPMARDPERGIWRVSVPLAPGRHTYSYVVNGTRWIIDPLAPRTTDDALGSSNVVTVNGAS